MHNFKHSTGDGITRRTVTRAIVWSVPAIATAVAAPVFAASPSGPVVVPGIARKLPGSGCHGTDPITGVTIDVTKGYLFPFQITNTSSTTMFVSGIAITVDILHFDDVLSNPALPTPIAPTQTITVWMYANSSSSANKTANATATVSWGATPSDNTEEPVVVTWQISSFPPITPQSCFPA